MTADLPLDVRDRAAQAVRETLRVYAGTPIGFATANAIVDAVADVLLGEDVIVLSRADAAWLCDVLHGEGQTEREYNRAHQLLEGGA